MVGKVSPAKKKKDSRAEGTALSKEKYEGYSVFWEGQVVCYG